MTDKRVPILNSSVVPTLGADSHFYLYGNGEVISLVPAWDGITVDDIYAFVDELPEGKAVDAIYVPFLHEQTDEAGTVRDAEGKVSDAEGTVRDAKGRVVEMLF